MFISKSKYLSGLQCHKLLWYQYNAKQQIPPIDASTQAIFDQGHLVGRLAQSLFRGGIEIGGDHLDFPRLFAETKRAVVERKPIFEATFRSGQAFARADILNPVAGGAWDIIEVKSSTDVKDVNVHDLALQRHVIEGSGLKVRKCILMHINNQHVRKGEIDPKEFFVQEDLSDSVEEVLPTVEQNLQQMDKVIRRKNSPDVRIGPHCSDPYNCILQELCWEFVPDDSPLSLYRFNKRDAFELIHDGVLSIRDLPRSFRLSEKQTIQVQAAKSGKPYIDKESIREFLESLVYPVYFLDFETFQTAIPMFDDVRPYQQVPFQFSLHIQASPGSKLEHHTYLADGKADPRPEFLAKLRPLLGSKGSVIAYNAVFEKHILKESCSDHSEHRAWWDKVEPRFVDLLTPFRSFWYYHPDQNGSASIKDVLPALTGKGYEDLEIAEGGTASLEYLGVTFGDCSESEGETVRRQLGEYCAMDTLGMAKIVDELGRMVLGH